MQPDLFYYLSDHEPGLLRQALARYDAGAVAALSCQCSAWIWRRDGVRFDAALLRSAWLRRGLITAEQAGFTAEALS